MYPDKVIYYLFDFDYVNSTLEPRPKLKQEELSPLQMGIMWIVLTFMAWCLVFLWISLPLLLCKMIITFFSLYLKTILLFRAPSHTGGHWLPNYSQGHITLFLFVENHSAWLWDDEVCIFIYLTTEHCFVFMREQWGVPQTRACILNEALASMLARLRVACSDSHQWWACPWVVLSHTDWGLTWVTGVTLCQWCVNSALSSGVAPLGEVSRHDVPTQAALWRSLHGAAEACLQQQLHPVVSHLGVDLSVTAKPPADCSSDWPLDCNLMRDSEPEVPANLTHTTCERW